MNCQIAQAQILESLIGPPPPGSGSQELNIHMAGCEACRKFSGDQLSLDNRLSAAIATPSLSPAFRASLAKLIRREPLTVWSEFLPDVAHVAGCVCATALCLSVLPFSAGPVILTGLALTLTTHFLQSVLRGSLEALEEE